MSHLDLLELVVVGDGDGLALQAAELEGGELLRAVLVERWRFLEADVGVGPGPGERAEDGAEEVDPEAGVEVARQRRPQGPRRVHRSARNCPATTTRFPSRLSPMIHHFILYCLLLTTLYPCRCDVLVFDGTIGQIN